MHKIISKILANRLVVVLGCLVNEIRSAFVADKQILDGPFILNELVQWCKKKKKQPLVFKVDFEKTYDSVTWDHLDDIMRKFGFREKWCMWIQSCLRSSRGSIIVNGSPTEEFQFYKGLKQGTCGMAIDYCIMKEGMSILRGRNSVPRISSSERENGKKGTTMSSHELHDKEFV
nr:cysteine-rich receptor-like protein kinase [Tanacetum cinerariifolium]